MKWLLILVFVLYLNWFLKVNLTDVCVKDRGCRRDSFFLWSKRCMLAEEGTAIIRFVYILK